MRFWPFSFPEDPGEQSRDFQAAQEATGAYFRGEATREEALDMWLAVVDDYPGTEEHDKALVRASALATTLAGPEKTRNVELSRQLIDRLASRPGPPSGWTVRAESSISGRKTTPDELLERRIAFFESVVARDNVDWIVGNVMVPLPTETPQTFIHRVHSFPVQMKLIKEMAAPNTISAARWTGDPVAAIDQIEERLGDDPVMQEAIQKSKLARIDPNRGRIGIILLNVAFVAAIVLLIYHRRHKVRKR